MIDQNKQTIIKLKEIWDTFFSVEPVNIFEFGSRYGEDSIHFSKLFPKANIFAFECNPNTIVECRENLRHYDKVILTEKAVCDRDGFVNFFKIDKEKTETTWEDGNQGASSMFEASGKYPIETYVQEKVEVESITLNTFIVQNDIGSVDILWMDIQGAELLALKGLKESLAIVKIIHIEVEFMEIYKNQPLSHDIQFFLESNDFIFLGFSNLHEYAGDAVFVRKEILKGKNKNKWVRNLNLIPENKTTIRYKLINKIKRAISFK